MFEGWFQGWARSDTVAVVACGISLIALFFSGYQAWLARKRLRMEVASKDPIVENVGPQATVWPGWVEERIVIRNRFEEYLYVESLTIEAPKDARIIPSQSRYTDDTARRLSVRKEPPDFAAVRDMPASIRIMPYGADGLTVILGGTKARDVSVRVTMSRGSQRKRLLTHTLTIRLKHDSPKAM